MSVSTFVKFDVSILHVVRDPRAIGVGAWCRASLDDRLKIPVVGNGVSLLAQHFAQTA